MVIGFATTRAMNAALLGHAQAFSKHAFSIRFRASGDPREPLLSHFYFQPLADGRVYYQAGACTEHDRIQAGLICVTIIFCFAVR